MIAGGGTELPPRGITAAAATSARSKVRMGAA
jgi:hypothetical protein